MPHPFLTTWSKWRPDGPPYLLPADRQLLSTLGDGACNCFSSWSSYSRSFDFAKLNNTALHLGLLPQPFFGNPATASVVVLALNPGVGPHDYFGEYRVPAYRRALVRSRKTAGASAGFLFLDPRFSWHGGFGYWHGRLRAVIAQLASHWRVPVPRATEKFARLFATIELLPYHSTAFGMSAKIMNHLPSVHLARAFVHDVLIPRAQANRCLIIVTRSARYWRLRKGRNVLVYRGTEARSAFLTPRSRGGARILAFLKAV